VAALACLLPASAWGSSPLRQRLSAALAGYHGAGTGAIAVDLTTGKAVFAHNAGASLLPASNEKLALTYAALVVLGPTFRMRTELLGEGHLRDGVVWEGDLVLRGYGDPTLDRNGLLELAGDLRESGIRRVTGGLIADESYFDARRGGPGWKSYFVPGESSPLSALSIGGADALATAKTMREALRASGVRVQGTTRRARAGGWPLAVRYSPHADDLLERLAAEHRERERVLVVSSDTTVLGTAGILVAKQSSQTFLRDLELPEHHDDVPGGLASKLDPETAARLERLRRGE